nr:hypothetical protein [Halarchaeum nitratireducens]
MGDVSGVERREAGEFDAATDGRQRGERERRSGVRRTIRAGGRPCGEQRLDGVPGDDERGLQPVAQEEDADIPAEDEHARGQQEGRGHDREATAAGVVGHRSGERRAPRKRGG